LSGTIPWDSLSLAHGDDGKIPKNVWAAIRVGRTTGPDALAILHSGDQPCIDSRDVGDAARKAVDGVERFLQNVRG
jgi:hypothetical protein